MRSLCLALLLAACGGSDPVMVDAAPVAADAYDTVRCLVPGNYGDLGAKTGTAGNVQGNPTMTITLDAGPPRDTFFLKLNPGRGAFSGGLANGTYPITGADADFTNCGLCINIIADIVTMVGPTKFYFAVAGSVTLTTTSPPTGSIAHVSFREVTASGAPVLDGCVASIGSLSFGP